MSEVAVDWEERVCSVRVGGPEERKECSSDGLLPTDMGPDTRVSAAEGGREAGEARWEG